MKQAQVSQISAYKTGHLLHILAGASISTFIFLLVVANVEVYARTHLSVHTTSMNK